MVALYNLFSTVISLLVWVVIVQAALSWLLAFNVINGNNRFVYMVWSTTNRITQPLLNPIRRFMPDLGGVDLSPIVLILGLFFLRDLLLEFLGSHYIASFSGQNLN